MNPEELEKFKQLLAAYEQALRLQRMRERTIETYRQYLWKVAKHFNRYPDNLSADELKSYFTWMLSRYAWNTVNVQVASLVFLYRHVLNREVEWGRTTKQKSPKSTTAKGRQQQQKLQQGSHQTCRQHDPNAGAATARRSPGNQRGSSRAIARIPTSRGPVSFSISRISNSRLKRLVCPRGPLTSCTTPDPRTEPTRSTAPPQRCP
jgi:hypothetical protein